MELPRDGGTGWSMGSKHPKGGRKDRSGKKEEEHKKQMEAMRQLKADKKERQDMDAFLFGPLKKLPGGGFRYERDAAQGKAATVRNPNGKPRTFQENMAFLTLCCSVYSAKALELPS